MAGVCSRESSGGRAKTQNLKNQISRKRKFQSWLNGEHQHYNQSFFHSAAGRKQTEMPTTTTTMAALAHRRKNAATSLLRKRTQAEPVDPANVNCEECGAGDRESEMLLCDSCDKGFHIFCLRPVLPRVPAGSWFCPLCQSRRIKEFPLVQTKIIDFFHIQRSYRESLPSAPDVLRRKRRCSKIFVAKKKRKLLPFVPSGDPDRILKQMGSLATALTTSGVEFSDSLTYMPGMAPRSANRALIEKGGMQVMSKEDKATLELCQEMCRQGKWPPLMVNYDPCEGFTVEADGFIRDLTIITEYVGDVDYLKNRENDEGDSMMTLLSTGNSSTTLVICPDKRSNIARFINGINNHTLEGKKKQNLKCVRYNVDGEARALLVAIRDIQKGERLYYDYNGSEHEYPTHNFV